MLRRSLVNLMTLSLLGQGVALAQESANDAATKKSGQPSSEQKEAYQDGVVHIYGDTLDPDRPVGSYQQPNWTTERYFPSSRTYLIPEHRLETELWIRAKKYKGDAGGGTQYTYQQEIEYGLTDRIQIDFYLNQIQQANSTMIDGEGAQFELRWALADWGKIPANPVIYLEYHPRKNDPDKAEVRFLFGGNLAPRLHWTLNFAAETELWGEEKEHEYAVTGGVAYSIFNKFGMGLEAKNEVVDVKQNRGHFARETYIGPMIQWRPVQGSHIDLDWLVGVNKEANEGEGYLIFGLDLN